MLTGKFGDAAGTGLGGLNPSGHSDATCTADVDAGSACSDTAGAVSLEDDSISPIIKRFEAFLQLHCRRIGIEDVRLDLRTEWHNRRLQSLLPAAKHRHTPVASASTGDDAMCAAPTATGTAVVTHGDGPGGVDLRDDNGDSLPVVTAFCNAQDVINAGSSAAAVGASEALHLGGADDDDIRPTRHAMCGCGGYRQVTTWLRGCLRRKRARLSPPSVVTPRPSSSYATIRRDVEDMHNSVVRVTGAASASGAAQPSSTHVPVSVPAPNNCSTSSCDAASASASAAPAIETTTPTECVSPDTRTESALQEGSEWVLLATGLLTEPAVHRSSTVTVTNPSPAASSEVTVASPVTMGLISGAFSDSGPALLACLFVCALIDSLVCVLLVASPATPPQGNVNGSLKSTVPPHTPGLAASDSVDLDAPLSDTPVLPFSINEGAAASTPRTLAGGLLAPVPVLLLVDEHSNVGCLVDDNVFLLEQSNITDFQPDYDKQTQLWDQFHCAFGRPWPGGVIPVVVRSDWGLGEHGNATIVKSIGSALDVLNGVIR